MKKLLGTLLLAPLAVTACDAAAKDPVTTTYTAYAYTHKGYISRADVTTDGTNITAVKLDETYAKIDATKVEWEEIGADKVTEAENKFKEEMDIVEIATTDKGVCISGAALYDAATIPTDATFDQTKVKPVAAAGIDGANIGGGQTMSKVLCEADTDATTDGVQPAGAWLEPNSKKYVAGTAVYDMAQLASLTPVNGMYTVSQVDGKTLAGTKAMKMKSTKLTSQDYAGVTYGKGRFDWKKNIDAITKYFVDEGKGYGNTNLWSRKLGKEGTTVDGETGITGATASDTTHYAKTIQAALKKAINA